MMFKLLKSVTPAPLKKKIKTAIYESPIISSLRKAEDSVVFSEQLYSLLRMKNEIPAIAPKHLQIRVSGAYYPNFFQHGKTMLGDLQAVLQKNGADLYRFNNILDFGCGCGRFMAPMTMMIDPKKLNGTDIDPEAIKWMQDNYPEVNDLDVNDVMPQTKYKDGSFDFIFSVSIFTHLPEDMHMEWVKELSRIMQPGGYGMFSTHGEFYHTEISKSEVNILKSHGFYYSKGSITDGLPDFYQRAFHTHEYIRREWGKYFEIVDIVKQGIGGGQDIVLVRKR